jgi:hypothetical protein
LQPRIGRVCQPSFGGSPWLPVPSHAGRPLPHSHCSSLRKFGVSAMQEFSATSLPCM